MTKSPEQPKPKAIRRKGTDTFPSAQLRRLAARNGVPRMTKNFIILLDKILTKRAEGIIRKADVCKGERQTIGVKEVALAYGKNAPVAAETKS